MPLLVCATPIGNLGDVTFRVIDALRSADLVVCEDTRQTRKLLHRYEIQADLLSFDQHRERARIDGLLARLEQGETVALVSDAGLPGLNDPGSKLIAAARDADLDVTVLPGATAAATALVASGVAAERYTFVGFLPRREGDRAGLWRESGGWSWPVVAFESPRRLASSLASLAAHDPGRPVAVCRELTKLHEQVVSGSAAEMAAQISGSTKGEITLVIGPPATLPEIERAPAVRAVSELVGAGAARRPAAKIVSELTGVPSNELYSDSLDASTK